MANEEYFVESSEITRKPTHPGVLFGRTMMPGLNQTPDEVARLLELSRQALDRFIAGDLRVDAYLAEHLGKLCGNGPRIWLAFQADFDDGVIH